MKLFKRAAAALSAAALTAAMAAPLSVYAADVHTVALNYGDLNDGEIFVLDVEDGKSVYSAIDSYFYFDDYRKYAAAYPAAKDGKAVTGWKKAGSDEAYDLSAVVDSDLELEPIVTDTVETGTFALTADESVLPAAGQDIPKDFESSITAPEGFTVIDAYYTGSNANIESAKFENDNTYFLYVTVVPESKDKTWDYSYTDNDWIKLNIEGATVNGSKANVIYRPKMPVDMPLEIVYPVTLGTPESYKLSLHFNGRGNAEDKTVDVPKADINNPYLLLDQAAGEIAPSEDGYVFAGWYKDAELKQFAGRAADAVVIEEDTDLYAKWVRVIDEINFKVETPLCGDVVELSNGEEPNPTDKQQPAGSAGFYSMEDRQGNLIYYTNEPQVSCDLENIDAGSKWITTDVPMGHISSDTVVELFTGTMYGENEYMFVINANIHYDDPVYFSKNLTVRINGTAAATGSGGAKPSTKAGIVSKAAVVSKGGNAFTVIGMITADHVWDNGVITKEAGCEDKGIKTFTCKSKDASYEDEIDAYGHKWLAWTVVTPATATEDGLEMRICDNDGEHKETRVIPKTGAVDSSGSDSSKSTSEASSQSSKPDSSAAASNNSNSSKAADNTQNAGTGGSHAAAAAVTAVLAAVVFTYKRKH